MLNESGEFMPFGDGSKFVCGAIVLNQQPSCLVYSIGSGGDWGFEQAIKAVAPNCEIHTFDPHPDRGPHKFMGSEYTAMHALALAGGSSGKGGITLTELMMRFGHSGRHIDILKIDCEGCEWDAFEHIFKAVRAGRFTIGQILVEMHTPFESGGERLKVHNETELQTFHGMMDHFFASARACNFHIFHKERNGWGTCNGYLCLEYALVHHEFACAAFVATHCPHHAAAMRIVESSQRLPTCVSSMHCTSDSCSRAHGRHGS